MGFSVTYYESNEDTLEAYLNGVIRDSEQTEKEALEEAGEQVKAYIVKALNKHRRTLAKRYKGRPAMADDVVMNVKNGTAKISGGKKTGTLWHIVNDGNLHSRPLFFMDGALTQMDGNIDRLWDKIDGRLKEG